MAVRTQVGKFHVRDYTPKQVTFDTWRIWKNVVKSTVWQSQLFHVQNATIHYLFALGQKGRTRHWRYAIFVTRNFRSGFLKACQHVIHIRWNNQHQKQNVVRGGCHPEEPPLFVQYTAAYKNILTMVCWFVCHCSITPSSTASYKRS